MKHCKKPAPDPLKKTSLKVGVGSLLSFSALLCKQIRHYQHVIMMAPLKVFVHYIGTHLAGPTPKTGRHSLLQRRAWEEPFLERVLEPSHNGNIMRK